MKIHSLFVLTALAPSLWAQKSTKAASPGDALITAAIRQPGAYSQMCDVQFIPRQVPLPLYSLTLDTEFELTPATLTKLREKRDVVIPALVKRLEGIDFSKAPKVRELEWKKSPTGKEEDIPEDVEDTGLDPKHLSQILLKMVIDLNATEAIPQLIRLEKDLSKRLEANNADPKNPVPDLQNDAGFMVGSQEDMKKFYESDSNKEPSPAEKKAQEAVHKRVQAIVAQRDLLATMLCLLRQEKYAPLLASDLEKSFAAELEKKSKEENFANIKTAADIPADDKNYVGFDPIHNLPCYPNRKTADVNYTPEVRQQILEWVADFERNTPAEKRLGSKGMAAVFTR